jgi:hypothetical protein
MLLTDGGGCFSKTMPGPHTARETTYFLSQNNINVFTSPSKLLVYPAKERNA